MAEIEVQLINAAPKQVSPLDITVSDNVASGTITVQRSGPNCLLVFNGAVLRSGSGRVLIGTLPAWAAHPRAFVETREIMHGAASAPAGYSKIQVAGSSVFWVSYEGSQTHPTTGLLGMASYPTGAAMP